MGREYVVQSWVKHDEDDFRRIPDHLLDESTGYSGEQVGNRLAKSNGNTLVRHKIPGWTEDKKADLGFYADQNEVSKANPLFSIDPAFKILASYQDQIQALDTALHAKIVTQSVYDLAVKVLNAKHEKAQQKLEKLAASLPEEETEQSQPLLLEEDLIPEYNPLPHEKAFAVYLYENSLTDR